MGSGCSTPELREQMVKNRAIDRDLERQKQDEIGDQKLLLLGTGECGKSTILKQMQILHNEGFGLSERTQLRSTIYTNLVKDMEKVLRQMEDFGLESGEEEEREEIKFIYNVLKPQDDIHILNRELIAVLSSLWANPNVQLAFERRSTYQVSECLEYFMNNFERLAKSDYIPTQEDILRVRIPTAGIVQITFPIKGVKFKVFDVGGQRSERRKWIHLFEDVNAIIYISAINEYDQVIMEDNTTNRMAESLQLFDQIANCKWFVRSSMILFLNKTDLFKQKILHKNISVFFTEYAGKQEYTEAVKYIAKKFLAMNKEPGRRIYVHETCATDTNQVQLVIDSVVDTVIAKNLRGTGMN